MTGDGVALSNQILSCLTTLSTLQKVWDAPLVKVQEIKVLSAANDQEGKAHLIVAAAPHSGHS